MRGVSETFGVNTVEFYICSLLFFTKLYYLLIYMLKTGKGVEYTRSIRTGVSIKMEDKRYNGTPQNNLRYLLGMFHYLQI